MVTVSAPGEAHVVCSRTGRTAGRRGCVPGVLLHMVELAGSSRWSPPRLSRISTRSAAGVEITPSFSWTSVTAAPPKCRGPPAGRRPPGRRRCGPGSPESRFGSPALRSRTVAVKGDTVLVKASMAENSFVSTDFPWGGEFAFMEWGRSAGCPKHPRFSRNPRELGHPVHPFEGPKTPRGGVLAISPRSCFQVSTRRQAASMVSSDSVPFFTASMAFWDLGAVVGGDHQVVARLESHHRHGPVRGIGPPRRPWPDRRSYHAVKA